MDTIYAQLDVWDAWWAGDRERLVEVYGGLGGSPTHPGLRDRPSQYRSGAVGKLSRWFWGSPKPVGQRIAKLHVPLAADIASTSAGLLFSEPPAITAEHEQTQARLEELLDDEWWATLTEAAELCAGLGGVYLRVGWDTEVSDRPIVTAIGPDLAIPTFRFGRLIEVTFVWRLSCDTSGVAYRHLENHRLENVQGVVEHALYKGTDDSLGSPVPFDDHPDMAPLVTEIDQDGLIRTGLDRITACFVPNIPSRMWRRHPIGAQLGQPDIAGVEPLLDALDEAYSSWMRDIRLGKARLVVPHNYLQTGGPGAGAFFDMDQELFTPVNALPSSDQMPMELIQPVIRHEEHAATCMNLTERAIDGSGYSLQTFGLQDNVAITATESDAREKKTNHTRALKIRYWSPGLASFTSLYLAVDKAVFASKVNPQAEIKVEFPPSASDDLETRARSTQLLLAGEAASMETRVRIAQPHLDDTEVDEEVQRIRDDQAAAMPPLLADPMLDNPDAGPDDQPAPKTDAQGKRKPSPSVMPRRKSV
jgi:A118 family predicted phage portal protein